MFASSVVDNKTGRGTSSEARTSTGTMLGKGRDEILKRIE